MLWNIIKELKSWQNVCLFPIISYFLLLALIHLDLEANLLKANRILQSNLFFGDASTVEKWAFRLQGIFNQIPNRCRWHFDKSLRIPSELPTWNKTDFIWISFHSKDFFSVNFASSYFYDGVTTKELNMKNTFSGASVCDVSNYPIIFQ